MRIYKLLSVALMAMLLSACTASLVVKDKGEAGNYGVPFRVPTVYIFSGVLTKHSQGVECDKETPFYETHALPLGKLYYANVETDGLAGSEFTIEFTDQGMLKKISLNSDTTAEAVSSGVANLLDKAAPFLAPVPTPAGTKSLEAPTGANEAPPIPPGGKKILPPPPPRLPPCDAGKVLKRVKLFEEFER